MVMIRDGDVEDSPPRYPARNCCTIPTLHLEVGSLRSLLVDIVRSKQGSKYRTSKYVYYGTYNN